MCKKITSARSGEEKAPMTLKVDKKAEVFVSSARSEVPLPIARALVYGQTSFVVMPERVFAPPVPVPIAA
jgi:hypothetical protein